MTPMLHRLTTRDQAIPRDLTRKVRRMTMRQIQLGYFMNAAHPRAAERTVHRLEAAGLISRHVVTAAPVPPMREPVLTWRPGQPLRCPKSVSRVLQLRHNADPVPTTVFAATPKACRMFGAPPHEFIESLKVNHDLCLTEVFVLALRTRPDVARRWVGETLYAELLNGQKLPDALVLDDAGRPELIIEGGGGYGPERVAAFLDNATRLAELVNQKFGRILTVELW